MINSAYYNSFENVSGEGKFALVTGANTGLGFETAKYLYQMGFTVIMGCRSEEKFNNAAELIYKSTNQGSIKGKLDFLFLDLIDLGIVKTAAQTYKEKYGKLDLLINNAGIIVPDLKRVNGFESHFVTNYLGHFQLTLLLLPLLKLSSYARVVPVCSLAHGFDKNVTIQSFNSENGFNARLAYGNSKLACLMFALTLQEKLNKSKILNVESVAAHPGVSVTEIAKNLPGWMNAIFKKIGTLIFQSAEKGASPILMAALSAKVKGGDYVGPSGWREYKGPPVIVQPRRLVKNRDFRNQLWVYSEKLTGISFEKASRI